MEKDRFSCVTELAEEVRIMKTDILEIHRNCLDFLLEWQAEHKAFYFVPRKNNRDNKLDKGLYFRGTDGDNSYMALTFWDATDKDKRLYIINWQYEQGETFIVISCRHGANKDKLPYVREIIRIIEAKGKKFEEKDDGKMWVFHYPSGSYYLDNLHDFIENDKPLIDQYLSAHPESGIPLADKKINDKYIKALPGYQEFAETIQKLKKTGSVTIKASEYIMTFQHNNLSNGMVAWLKKNGYSDVKSEHDYVDISCRDPLDNKILFELKTAQTVKAAIREAIGQLMEYNHYPNKNKADKLIIVTVLEPTKDDIQYLTGLRAIYHIPVFYQQFNVDTKQLSKEY